MVATVAGLAFALLCMAIAHWSLLKRNRELNQECDAWESISNDWELSSLAWETEAKEWRDVAEQINAKSSARKDVNDENQ